MINEKWTRTWWLVSILCLSAVQHISATDNQHYLPSLQCYDGYGRPQRCIPQFENAAFQVPIESTNTCGEGEDEQTFCVQTGYSNRKSCDRCSIGDHSSQFLTDLHDPNNPTWWQSETMFEGIHQSKVNLTLNLGKSFDITYIRVVFYSPRPESFAIYKRSTPNGPWTPYQYYSATCRETYSQPDNLPLERGEAESRALCTSEYSDISPLRDGNVAFSSLEGRPSAINFDHSTELQSWVTATDIRIVLDRLNTFGDEVFGDTSVLQSYFYAIADVAVGARCKCNGHASECIASTGITRTRVCDCKHNTDGPDCEKCLPLFNDAPWGRATSKNVHECKPCNCNDHSNKCFFDRHLYNLTGHGGHCLDCQRNRDGPNCERCKENFFMNPDEYCINCNCDPVGSRTLQCNSEGKCQCKPGVTGEKCDRCEANHFNFGPQGCKQCECDVRGSLDSTPSCDPDTGVCLCKENVEGRRCRECRPGFFNLDVDNKFGCTPCFCYGHTSECQSAMGYTMVSTTSNFNKQNERWVAVDEFNRPIDVKYSKYSKNIGITAKGNSHLYFSAPDRFLGDQRASYNRLLKFRLQLIDQARPSISNDVILEGAGTKISLHIFAQKNEMPDQEFREYSFRLHENSEYSWQPSQSSRGFMSILSNLTAIKIRGTYSTKGEAFLDDIELQTAYRGSAGRPATWIEQCTCPEGYLGQFCESCAPGYRHSPAHGGPFMRCIPCDCNKHADICDSETGRCICKHNTTGDTCDQCAKGFYGNALDGSEYDCKRCPCMDNGACLQLGEDIICLECPAGYFGQRCELCADGYFGDPSGLTGPVRQCQACDCNGNVDPNAVGNCNRTTGECLKCIHNTGGPRCDECLKGHFGDPLSLPHGNCDACSCYPQGTEQTEDGISICEQLSGNCRCKPNVIGHNCNECQSGYFNIKSGNGCEGCKCDPIGSFNASCDRFNGQCYCKPGVTGLRCDQCEANQYGFSTDGCKQCDCDESGSKGFQCDEFGQCPCNDNVEGRRCNRCKENKFDRHSGCLDCPSCYNLVQDAADDHREKLQNLSSVLAEIASKPTVIDDSEFDSKLRVVQEKIDILAVDVRHGAGGDDLTLLERLNKLRSKLNDVRDILDKSDELQQTANLEVDRANVHVTKAEETIDHARKELTDALELLQTSGVTSLSKAKDRSDQFGQQSNQISEISRQARLIVDALEAQAEEKKANAQEAITKSQQAYDLAKNSFALQSNISDELRSNIRREIGLAKSNLDATSTATKEALTEASDVYNKALTLLTNVNTLVAPTVNIEKLKNDAITAGKHAERLREITSKLTDEHDELLNAYDENVELAETLYERAQTQQEDAASILAELNEIYDKAKKAVALGDNTLKEANNTYHTLAGFHSQVQQSSENARLALETVSQIKEHISEAIRTVEKAEEALSGANTNAEEAKRNAEEAQKKYAEQASIEAEKIRLEANDTKTAANKLYSEADYLSGRVHITDDRINRFEEISKKDDDLTQEARVKVGQAQSDATEAKKQVTKATQEVQAIMDELKSLQDINESDLDALEIRLNQAEDRLQEANLSNRMETLNDQRIHQNQFIKDHQNEIAQLVLDVANIRDISEALPEGCFKRTRLEL